MKTAIKHKVRNYFLEIFEMIVDNPKRNLLVLLVSLVIITFLAAYFYEYFGFFTWAGFIILSITGISKAIENPRRIFIWALGFVISSIAIKMFFELFLPSFSRIDLASVIGALIFAYLIVLLFLKSRQLKAR